MDEEELTEFMATADFYAELNPKQHHTSIVYVGETKYEDRMCHELRRTTNAGDMETHYVDMETYRRIGWIGKVETNMGPMQMTRFVESFKTFDGEVIPVAYTDDIGGMMDMVSTVTEVSFDNIELGAFDPPEALVKAP